jgi:hypothetical protein
MKENSPRKNIKVLKQRLIALDCERNEIIAQINQLKNAQQIARTTQDDIFTPEEKTALFRSLFRGREDVYARRWQNKAGKSGYSPHCANEWKSGVCQKPRIKCSACKQKSYVHLSDDIIEAHLRGEIVIGLYPMTEDEKCYFLAIDFDEVEWIEDIAVLRAICQENEIPMAVERSRSGKGAHVWIFFEDAISASLARKLGSAILTHAMNKRHEITFKSYDRLFPNQDTMPKGGFGNLIALPLQAVPRKSDNSIFINEYFLPYEDQWKFLGEVTKLSERSVIYISPICFSKWV